MVERLKATGRKIVVFADILELGELSERCHREVGAYVAGKQIDCLITIGTEAAYIAEQAKSVLTETGQFVATDEKPADVMQNRVKLLVCANREEAFAKGLFDLQPGDVVYMKGSHGMRLDLLAQQIREKYSGR